jgi:hypothetical protein
LPHAANPQAAASNTAVNAKCPARIFRFSQIVLKGTQQPREQKIKPGKSPQGHRDEANNGNWSLPAPVFHRLAAAI